jgi:hypothetical protein
MPLSHGTLIREFSMTALLVFAIGVGAAPLGERMSPDRSSLGPAEGVVLFRGTTSFRDIARATTPSRSPVLSPDRIARTLPGEGSSPIPSHSDIAAPIVDATPVAGEPANLLTDFNGLDAFDNLVALGGLEGEPPDQGLCVGNGFVLESINVTIRAFKTSGSPRGRVLPTNAFYGLPPLFDPDTELFGPSLTDPSCLFDPETGRFFHVILTLDTDPTTGDFTGRNFLDIAVSRSSDPTGQWNLYRVDVTNDGTAGTPNHGCPGATAGSTGPCIGDYPHIGLDESGFVITTNEYAFFDPSETFMGAQMYAMSKSRLAGGAANVPLLMFENLKVPERNQVGFTLRAANVPGTSWSTAKHGTVFFASGMVGPESGNSSPDYDAITLWALSNTSSLNTASPSLKLRHKVVNTLQYETPPPSAQRPGDLPLAECLNSAPCISVFGPPPSPQGLSLVDSLDGRMLGTWFADELLWFSLGTGVNVAGQDLAGIMYGAVEPFFKNGKLKGRVRMQEYLGVQGNNMILPSVGLDANGRGFLAFTLVGPDHFPSAAVAKISLDHPAQKVSVVEGGVGPQDGFSGYWIGGPRPRWGDYSYTAVDEQGNVWAAVEFIAQTCTFDEWIGGDLTCGGTRGALANFATRVMELK